MPSLLMFTREIQNKVSVIFDCSFGLKGIMEEGKYQNWLFDKIKKVRLRAVNFYKSKLKDDYIYVGHDPNKIGESRELYHG